MLRARTVSYCFGGNQLKVLPRDVTLPPICVPATTFLTWIASLFPLFCPLFSKAVIDTVTIFGTIFYEIRISVWNN